MIHRNACTLRSVSRRDVQVTGKLMKIERKRSYKSSSKLIEGVLKYLHTSTTFLSLIIHLSHLEQCLRQSCRIFQDDTK